MKTTDYKKGDVVILSDVGRDARFEYLGEAGCTRHAYRPLDGKTGFATMKTDAVGEFAPFPNKVAVKAVERKMVSEDSQLVESVGHQNRAV